MGDFFKPWRRKVGVATLVMACVFSVGWVRSQTRHEKLSINFGAKSAVVANSHPSGLLIFYTWKRQVCGLAFEPYVPDSWWQWDETLLGDTERQSYFPYISLVNGPTRWTSGKIYGGIRLIESSYWSIVVPLTLHSAYLLLSSHRSLSRSQKF
jgi:hypothetical protein